MSLNELDQNNERLSDLSPSPYALLAQHEYETLLYARAVRLLRCPPDAWDLVQDTFEHALRGFGSFQPGSNMRVWLMTIMQHLFIDRCRKRAREPWVEPIDDDIVATVEPEVNNKPEWATISDEHVADALEELESPFREVYKLRLLDKCSYDEIAERLLIPRSTVGTRLMRARKKLQQTLRRRASAEPMRASA
jgi:RNA polymerase sigma-70 factor (ECF subfamily)